MNDKELLNSIAEYFDGPNTSMLPIRTLMDAMPIGLVVSDLNARLLYANKEAKRLWGYTLTDDRHTWEDFAVRSDDDTPIRLDQMCLPRLLSGDIPERRADVWIFQSNSTHIPVEALATVVTHASGQVLGAIITITNITQRRALEQAQRDTEARNAAVLASALECIIVMNSDGQVIEFNDAAQHTFGYTRSEAIGRTVAELIIPPRLHDDHSQGLTRYLTTGIGPLLGHRIEVDARRADGQEIPVELTITPYEANGQTIFTAYLRDITERKRTEQELQNLLSAAQTQAMREALVNQIADAIRDLSDVDEIQSLVTLMLGTAMQVDRCYFNYVDAAGDHVRVGPDWHQSDLFSLQGDYKISDFQLTNAELYPNGKTRVADDLLTTGFSEITIAAFLAIFVRAGISVPLLDKGEIVASLTVAMSAVPRHWTEEEVNLVEAVATLTRATVEAVRIRQRAVAIATTLQSALQPSIPDELSEIKFASYYKAALDESSIGGDFYDVFELRPNVTAIVIGDLSGKGLAAASQVATIRNMLRYTLYRNSDLAQAITELNETVSDRNLLTGFVTLIVGIVDRSTMELTYVSTGHEPGLLRREEPNQIIEMPPTGPILGAVSSSVYVAKTLPLISGDILVFYTDGLTDAAVSRSQSWGLSGIEERLASIGPNTEPGLIVKAMISDATSFAHYGFQDDVSLLVAVVG